VDFANAAPRVTAVNAAPIARRGAYVLYWMIAARRTAWSFALDHAIAHAVALGRPLVVFEPLRAGYRWRAIGTTRSWSRAWPTTRARAPPPG
jgi:hypothetical protein